MAIDGTSSILVQSLLLRKEESSERKIEASDVAKVNPTKLTFAFLLLCSVKIVPSSQICNQEAELSSLSKDKYCQNYFSTRHSREYKERICSHDFEKNKRPAKGWQTEGERERENWD